MLIDKRKEQIKYLMTQPQWKAVEQVMEELCQRIKQDSVIRSSQWDTLVALFKQEGEVSGIRKLLQELYLNLQ